MIIAGSALTSCAPVTSPAGNDDQPVSSDDTPQPALTLDPDKYEIGENGYLESIEILILESFPLQVNVRITGNLPDGCTTVYRMESERQDDRFIVKVITAREKDLMCTEALVPFETSATLDVLGLPAGTYRVEARDLKAEFTFTQDNSLAETSGG